MVWDGLGKCTYFLGKRARFTEICFRHIQKFNCFNTLHNAYVDYPYLFIPYMKPCKGRVWDVVPKVFAA